MRLFTTVMHKKPIMATYPILSSLLEYLNDLVVLFVLCTRVLFAKMYDAAMATVAKILTTRKAPMLLSTIPAINGLSSLAPE